MELSTAIERPVRIDKTLVNDAVGTLPQALPLSD